MADFLFDEGKNKIEGLNKDAINEALRSKADAQAVASAFESVNEALNGKASTQALNELSQTVNGKADANAVNQALLLKADKTELNNYVKKYGSKELELVPNQTYTNYRMSYRSEDPDFIYIAAANGYNAKAYKVTAGETYKIRAFGYDVDSFYIAAIGENLVEGGQTTNVKQVVLCGGSSYPSDFKNHDITFTAEFDGYLYINERPSTGVESYTKGFEHVVVRNENCLIVNNGVYKHLAYIGNGLYLNRQFTRRGPNNLFQLVHVGIGYLTEENAYVETKSYMTTTTDIVGPFSIGKSGWSSNAWSGGNHGVTIDDVTYPTAEQLELNVYVGNELITENGIYWGEVKFVAKNKLYFAQTITGNTFEGATAAIVETRVYNLTDTMFVEVYIDLLDDVRFAKYYGMQYVNNNVVSVIVPNDETIIDTTNLENNYTIVNKQSDIILKYNDGAELHMLLNNAGLGSYDHNDGTDGFGLIATYEKTYHTLISTTSIESGKQLYWSGEYKMIV